MKRISFIFTLVWLWISIPALAQKKLGVYSVAFYNIENLWDTDDDPNNSGDDDYTPEGRYQWTPEKYRQKLLNAAMVLSQLGKDYCPMGAALIGVSEIENRRVLEDLMQSEPLRSIGYQVIHFESPDHRGIDVAALYNPRIFTFEKATIYPYNNPEAPDFKTRDQLLVSGKLAGEPFHMIVNHWPSRYGGNKSSPSREFAAAITKHIADSIRRSDPEAKIVIVGDLNDDPYNKSCSKVLEAQRKTEDTPQDGYYNTTWKLYDDGIGTLCYQGQWNLFDQQIISGNLLGADKRTLKFWKTEIFSRPFLLQQEGKYKGYPFRSFSGNVFQGGFSDHLPTVSYYVKIISDTPVEE